MKVVIEAWNEGDDLKLVTDPIEGNHAEIAAVMHEISLRGYTQMTAHRLDMVCDFCSDPSVVCRFQIEPGGHIGTIMADGQEITHMDRDGIWGACHWCASCIEREAWTDLADRAISHIPQPMREIFGPAMVAGPHGCFRAGYKGDKPIPVISDSEIMKGGI